MKLIITEKNTIEGFTAHWVASRILAGLNEKFESLQVEEGSPLPDVKNKEVLMFGVTYPRAVLLKMKEQAMSITVFDNTFEARQAAGGLRFVRINMTRSPARLAWEYFRGNMAIKVNNERIHLTYAPWIVDFSDSAKLWKWPSVKHYFIQLAIVEKYEATLESWDLLASKDIQIVETEGREFAKKQQEEEEKENGKNKTGNTKKDSGTSKQAGSKPGVKKLPGNNRSSGRGAK